MIVQDTANRMLSDAKIAELNAKETTAGSQAKVNTLKTEVDGKIGILTGDVDGHKAVIASPSVLGHVKVGANLSIDGEGVLNADASEVYALTDESMLRALEDMGITNLDSVTETGFYAFTTNITNRPNEILGTNGWMLSVYRHSKGIIQTATRQNPSAGSWDFGRAFDGATWTIWSRKFTTLSDNLNDNSITTAATANAVKQLNDIKANKQDSLTNVVTAVLQSGWTPDTSTVPLKFFKDGFGNVRIYGAARPGTKISGTVISTLQIGYRSVSHQRGIGGVIGHNVAIPVIIYSDGRISLNADLPATAEAIFFDITLRIDF